MANRRQVNIHLSEEEDRKLTARAAASGVTRGYLVRRWTLEQLNKAELQPEAAQS